MAAPGKKGARGGNKGYPPHPNIGEAVQHAAAAMRGA
jgi:hypothetical protein